jgi:hypothetical protein
MFSTYNSSGELPKSYSDSLVTGDYAFYCIVYDSSINNIKAYQNLIKFADYTVIPVNSGNIRYGYDSGTRYLNGELSSQFIFNRALTQNEITSIYNAGKDAYSPVTDGLVAQYSGRDFNGTSEEPNYIFDTCSSFYNEDVITLTPGTEYTYKGIATYNDTTLNGNELEFNATSFDIAIADKNHDSITVSYNIDNKGYAIIIDTYYRIKGSETWLLSTGTLLPDGPGIYTKEIINLQSNTEYEIRGYFEWDGQYSHDLYIEETTYDRPPISRLFFGIAIAFLCLGLGLFVMSVFKSQVNKN